MSDLHQIFDRPQVLPAAVARSSSGGVAIRYVGLLQVLWMTYVHIMGRMDACPYCCGE